MEESSNKRRSFVIFVLMLIFTVLAIDAIRVLLWHSDTKWRVDAPLILSAIALIIVLRSENRNSS